MNAQSLHDTRWHTIVLQKEGIEFAVFDENLTLEYTCCDFGKAGESLSDLIPELEGMEETICAAMKKGEEINIMRLNRHKGDQPHYVDLRLLPIEKKLLVIFRDISRYGLLEQNITQQRNEMYLFNDHLEKSCRALEEISGLDELTHLPNCRAANQLMLQKFQQAGLQQRPLSVIFFDLDNFKEVNDQHGHYISKKSGGHQITSFDIGTINGRP